MQPFEFKEALLQRTMFVGFFLIMAGLITVACFLKAGEGLVWLVGGLLAGIVTAILGLFLFQSYYSRQYFKVNADEIVSQSKARGTIRIFWHELEAVKEGKGKISNIREAIPGLEVFITSYVMLPSTGSGERLGTLYLSDSNGQIIFVRQYLVYPSNLDKLLAAIELYSPLSPSQTLGYNTHN
jgi:hypothetical protein